MSKILIIEDEEAIADLERDYLELSGFEVEIANRGDTGLDKAMKEEYDLIILDLMLPEVDGFDICRQIREEKNTPIIMVSAKKDDIDKIRGLGLGADDYMTKPFQPMELVARVQAQLRRYTRYNPGRQEETGVLRCGGLRLDTLQHTVTLDGRALNLTPTEFTILKMLMENPGKVLSAEQLYFGVWGESYYNKNTNTITSHIRHLREKMGESQYIRTVWGIGYKLGEGGQNGR